MSSKDEFVVRATALLLVEDTGSTSSTFGIRHAPCEYSSRVTVPSLSRSMRAITNLSTTGDTANKKDRQTGRSCAKFSGGCTWTWTKSQASQNKRTVAKSAPSDPENVQKCAVEYHPRYCVPAEKHEMLQLALNSEMYKTAGHQGSPEPRCRRQRFVGAE